MRRTTTLFAALLAILLGSFATDSYAQGVQTGSVRGTVTDQQSLPVPGVTVTIQSPALQGVRTSVTAGDGSYTFVRLPAGRYEMTFEIASFAPVKRTTDVLLGLSVEQNITLTAAGRTEEVQVVAASPAPIINPTVGANYKKDEIDLLAVPRTLQGIASLAPGLTENTPNAGQVAINGGFAYDNVFMVNGIDVNDNLFANAAEPLHRGRDRRNASADFRHLRRIRAVYGRRDQRRHQERRQQLLAAAGVRTLSTRRGRRRHRSSGASLM